MLQVNSSPISKQYWFHLDQLKLMISDLEVESIWCLGLDITTTLPRLKSILKRLVDEDERILKDPETVIAVSELADNSVNIVVRPWTKSGDYWGVYWDLTENVKLTFDKEGISIPYPQRDVHLHQVA